MSWWIQPDIFEKLSTKTDMFSLILFVTLIKKTDKFQENKKTSNTKTDTFYFFIQNPSNGQFF